MHYIHIWNHDVTVQLDQINHNTILFMETVSSLLCYLYITLFYFQNHVSYISISFLYISVNLLDMLDVDCSQNKDI